MTISFVLSGEMALQQPVGIDEPGMQTRPDHRPRHQEDTGI